MIGSRVMLLTGLSGMGVTVEVGVGGSAVVGASVAVGWIESVVAASMTGGGGVLVGGTAVLITGWARVGLGETAVASEVSLL